MLFIHPWINRVPDSGGFYPDQTCEKKSNQDATFEKKKPNPDPTTVIEKKQKRILIIIINLIIK